MLRNKKTGEVVDGYVIVAIKSETDPSIIMHDNTVGSVAKLNEKWEDYKPTKPLIKDPKIRKAVRAWAEANGIEQVIIDKSFSTYTFYPSDTDRISISVWTEPSLSNLSKDKAYTIAELCGEEEE